MTLFVQIRGEIVSTCRNVARSARQISTNLFFFFFCFYYTARKLRCSGVSVSSFEFQMFRSLPRCGKRRAPQQRFRKTKLLRISLRLHLFPFLDYISFFFRLNGELNDIFISRTKTFRSESNNM